MPAFRRFSRDWMLTSLVNQASFKAMRAKCVPLIKANCCATAIGSRWAKRADDFRTVP